MIWAMINITELLDKWKVILLNEIHTKIPGTIISFDPVKMEASVLPLARPVIEGKEVEPQIIERCPVCFLNDSTFAVRHPLQKGDLVIIGFSETSLEKILTSKKPESVTKNGRFNLTDGIVLGTIDGEYDEMPVENSNDLLIINKETGHKIVFKADGSIDTTVEIITALNATSIKAPLATIECKNLIASDSVEAGKNIKAGVKMEAPTVSGTEDVMIAGKSGKNHKHKYMSGDGTERDSSPPN